MDDCAFTMQPFLHLLVCAGGRADKAGGSQAVRRALGTHFCQRLRRSVAHQLLADPPGVLQRFGLARATVTQGRKCLAGHAYQRLPDAGFLRAIVRRKEKVFKLMQA